jgi:hypothetical protein
VTIYFVNCESAKPELSRFEKACERKAALETEYIWKPQLYVGGTFRSRRGGLQENEVVEKIRSWTDRLASRSKGHIIIDAVWEYKDNNWHFHGTVLAEKKVTCQLAKSLWKEGIGDFRVYDQSQGGVIYNHLGHNDTYLVNRVACHRRSGSCRRNKCPYQHGVAPVHI